MRSDADHRHDDPAGPAPCCDPQGGAPQGALRLVASIIALAFAELLPALRRRPDLAVPLLAALRALGAAAWGCRPRASGRVAPERVAALRAAVLRLRDLLVAVAADGGWGEGATRGPAPAPDGAGRAPRALSPGPRFAGLALARDGPPPLFP